MINKNNYHTYYPINNLLWFAINPSQATSSIKTRPKDWLLQLFPHGARNSQLKSTKEAFTWNVKSCHHVLDYFSQCRWIMLLIQMVTQSASLSALKKIYLSEAVLRRMHSSTLKESLTFLNLIFILDKSHQLICILRRHLQHSTNFWGYRLLWQGNNFFTILQRSNW